MHNLEDTVALLQALCFTIHPDKSQLIPTQKITFLGILIDSTKITLKLTKNKQNKIFTLCKEVIKSKVQSIRKIVSLLGNIVASFEAVPRNSLYYRNIELCKIEALKAAKGNFECKMSLWNLWNLWLSPAHIPSVHNVIVDSESRKFRDASEWMISEKIFKRFSNLWGKPEIDLFATRLNSKLQYMCHGSQTLDLFQQMLFLYHRITVTVTVSLHLA